MVGVLDKYEVTKTDQELCMLMAQKNHDTSNADFDGLCNSVSEIQRLMKSGNKRSSGEKEVHLAFIEGDGTFKGKCRNCSKVCGYKVADCKK